MTGYVRQSISEILPGQEIKADPLNEEFNALATAFNSSSGHAHDGTSGSGPKINLTSSVIGNLPANNLGNDSIPHVKLENIADNKVLGNVSGVEASVSTVDILDEDNMISNRDDALPTQQSVKAYVDTLDAAIVVALDDVVDYVDGEIADLATEIQEELENNIINKPCFLAHKNGTNQNQPSAGTYQVTWSTKQFDVGGHFDTGTGRYTPPAGKYRFSIACCFRGNNGGQTAGMFRIELRKNGTTVAMGTAYRGESNESAIAVITKLDEANGTDYYEVFARGDTAATAFIITGASSETWFCGEQI